MICCRNIILIIGKPVLIVSLKESTKVAASLFLIPTFLKFLKTRSRSIRFFAHLLPQCPNLWKQKLRASGFENKASSAKPDSAARFVTRTGQIDKRRTETAKLGFKQAVIPKLTAKGLSPIPGIEVMAVEKVDEALEKLR